MHFKDEKKIMHLLKFKVCTYAVYEKFMKISKSSLYLDLKYKKLSHVVLISSRSIQKFRGHKVDYL